MLNRHHRGWASSGKRKNWARVARKKFGTTNRRIPGPSCLAGLEESREGLRLDAHQAAGQAKHRQLAGVNPAAHCPHTDRTVFGDGLERQEPTGLPIPGALWIAAPGAGPRRYRALTLPSGSHRDGGLSRSFRLPWSTTSTNHRTTSRRTVMMVCRWPRRTSYERRLGSW
jgi:hypothetical protein